MTALLTSEQVCARARCSYRQLDYWTRTGRVPGVTRLQVPGSGYPRRWRQDEAALVIRLGQFVRAGIALRVAAEVLRREVAAGNDVARLSEVRLTDDVVLQLRPALHTAVSVAAT